jgi:hypothetical protein
VLRGLGDYGDCNDERTRDGASLEMNSENRIHDYPVLGKWC